MPTLALLPLDDRPPNVEFPAMLARAAGLTPLTPPKSWLGTPWRGGDIPQLREWLLNEAVRADALVIALDTLGYGGLVNSRRSSDAVDTVLARLNCLRELKHLNPDLTILAYSVLMRISRHDSAEEEKGYWASYGAKLFRISYLEDKLSMMAGTADDEEELMRLSAQVPPEIAGNYLQGRERNHAVNQAMIRWTADGLFDYLVIPQDDTVEFGWNIAERRRLLQLVRQLDVADRVSIYPGTDETDMLLVARYAAEQANVRPRVWPRYSTVRAGQVITAYEDRPMEEMIKAHLGPLNGSLAATPSDAHICLYVNTPAQTQGDGPDQYPLMLGHDDMYDLTIAAREAIENCLMQPHLQTTLRELNAVERDVHEFARSLAADMAAGRLCAVADVAFVNGADITLAAALTRTVDIAQLGAYAGWNTAGNTLGTTLAHSVIRSLQLRDGATADQLAAHIAFLFLRWVDDYLYQARIRTETALTLLPDLGAEPTLQALGPHHRPVADIVAERLTAAAAELAEAHFQGQSIRAGQTPFIIEQIGIHDAFLPWRRLFEVGFSVTLQTNEADQP